MKKKNFIPFYSLRISIRFITIISIATLFSCKKFIEVEAPITNTNAANVFKSDATAAAVLTGIYIKMSQSVFTDGGLTSLSLYPSLSADELTLYNGVSNPVYLAYYKNALTNSNTGNDFWKNIYPIIFITNSAIEGLSNSKSLTPSVRQHLLGEAKFMRAFCYFYLVNLYGDVPLAISSDYQANKNLGRSSKSEVYQQVISDLLEAQQLLSDNYLSPDIVTTTSERVRPNRSAATALLSRAYLYTGDFANAESQATVLISNSSLYMLTDISNVFKKNNPEAIWQLQPVISVLNTWDAYLFVLPTNGPNTSNYPVYLSSSIINSFDSSDLRKSNWVGSVTPSSPGNVTYFYPYKYKAGVGSPLTEYTMILRLAEQYLIRAEARAQLGNLTGAQEDINAIRSRAGLINTTAGDKDSLLTEIMNERKLELFTEWGHRWLDLKRTNNVDPIMSTVSQQKGGSWNSNWQWYPIPINELKFNLNLKQNLGY